MRKSLFIALFALIAVPALAENLKPCGMRYYCPMIADNTAECTAVFGRTHFRERARRSDNFCSIGKRLRDRVCARGYDASKFTIVCAQR